MLRNFGTGGRSQDSPPDRPEKPSSRKSATNAGARRRKKSKRVVATSRSTGSMRNQFRDNFWLRLRSSRSRSLNRFRQFMQRHANIPFDTLSDLRHALQGDPDASRLMANRQVNDFLEELERDLVNRQLQMAVFIPVVPLEQIVDEVREGELQESLDDEEVCNVAENFEDIAGGDRN